MDCSVSGIRLPDVNARTMLAVSWYSCACARASGVSRNRHGPPTAAQAQVVEPALNTPAPEVESL